MGVPSFFVWLINNFGIKNVVVPKLNKRAKRLYIDANCAIHPKCFEILKRYQEAGMTDKDKMEQEMIRHVIDYIDTLIQNVNPSDLVYISVDGVAPMAKIQQQRKRRYKVPIEERIRNTIKFDNAKDDSVVWSNIVITPGTVFMENLHAELLKYVDKKTRESTTVYAYSSYHVPGEGEHKILADIKKSKNSDDIYVIYGLDADLIFLSFASQKNNIYLYRENNQLAEIFKHVTSGLCYVDIESVKSKYYDEILKMLTDGLDILTDDHKLKTDVKLKKQHVINDFIVLCFLAGNDFLPSIPSITITCSMNQIIESYVTILSRLDRYLVTDNYAIDILFFEELLRIICQYETKQVKYLNRVCENKKKCKDDDKFKQDVFKLENMQGIVEPEQIDLQTGDIYHIKSRYYDYYFGITEYYNEGVDMIVNKYLEGIIWTLRYYFDSCPSWNWYYPYSVSPFLSDVLVGVKAIDINRLVFKPSAPLTPFKQLLIVIPEEYKDVIPDSLLKTITNLSLDHVFLKNLVLDTSNKTLFWKCVPYLPVIDHATVDKIYSNTQFSKTERIRDRIDFQNYPN